MQRDSISARTTSSSNATAPIGNEFSSLASGAGLTPATFANIQPRKRGRPPMTVQVAINARQLAASASPSKRLCPSSSDTADVTIQNNEHEPANDNNEHEAADDNAEVVYGDDEFQARNKFLEMLALQNQADWAHLGQAGTKQYIRPQQEFKV
jgi:hypothetical protein